MYIYITYIYTYIIYIYIYRYIDIYRYIQIYIVIFDSIFLCLKIDMALDGNTV